MSALHTAAVAALDVERAQVAAGMAGPWVLDDGIEQSSIVPYYTKDGEALHLSAGYGWVDDAALIVASVNARAAALDLAGMVFEGHAPKMVGTQGPFCHRCNSPTITMSPSHPCALYTAALRVVGVRAEDFQ